MNQSPQKYITGILEILCAQTPFEMGMVMWGSRTYASFGSLPENPRLESLLHQGFDELTWLTTEDLRGKLLPGVETIVWIPIYGASKLQGACVLGSSKDVKNSPELSNIMQQVAPILAATFV